MIPLAERVEMWRLGRRQRRAERRSRLSSGIMWVRDGGMAYTEVEPPVDPRRIPGASSTPPAMDYDD